MVVADRRDHAAFLLDLSRRGGDVVEFRSSVARTFLVNSPELARYVLAEAVDLYSCPPHPYEELIGFMKSGARGLFGGHGSIRDDLGQHESVLTSLASELVQSWLRAGRPVAIEDDVKQLAFRAIVKLCFGVEDAGSSNAFIRASNVFEELWVNSVDVRGVREWAELRSAQLAAVDEIATAAGMAGTAGRVSEGTRGAIIRTLLNAYNATGTALCWSLYLLARHVDLAQRIRDDLERDDRSLLTNVVQEALRLYPPAWNLARTALRDGRIGATDVPRGSTVFVCPYTLQRLPSLWPDPDRFVPERFDGRLPHPYAFLPFGAGSRRCPAARYVPRHVEAVLAAILRAARLELASAPVAPRGLVALRPAEPVMIAVRA